MTSPDRAKTERIAVLAAGDEAGERAIERRLQQLTGEPTFYGASDCDRLNDAACTGEFASVLIADMNTLIIGVLDGDFDLDAWLQIGVQIKLADPALAGTDETDTVLPMFYRSVSEWRRKQRRRKLIFASILTLATLVSLTAFLLLIRVPAS